MKFYFDVLLREPSMDMDYRRKIISLFKCCMTQYQQGQYYQSLFGVGVKKQYSWAVSFEKPVFEKDHIFIESKKMRVLFSCWNKSTAVLFFNSLLEQKNQWIEQEGQGFKIVHIEMMVAKKIHTNAVQCKIVSPIVLREHQPHNNHDYYYSVAHEQFIARLKESIAGQIADYDGRLLPLVEQLKINSSGCKKTVVTHYQQKIECTIGTIGFLAPPQLLEALVELGVGSRKAAGFGMLNVQQMYDFV